MKRYLTQESREYILRAKGYLQHMLAKRGLSHGDFSEMTGIPRTTLQRWLSTSNDGFMTLVDAVVICQHLGISVHDMLPEPCWPVREEQQRTSLLRRLEQIPQHHLQSLLVCYEVISG
ncbi:helix-turn-helix domain-containing protein [Aeromonas diversa]|uniref:helix-turn-helix domain-containing protein n=1 Tax=Aeromonas diversa TaxID=502790 RepID=UPI0039A22F64